MAQRKIRGRPPSVHHERSGRSRSARRSRMRFPSVADNRGSGSMDEHRRASAPVLHRARGAAAPPPDYSHFVPSDYLLPWVRLYLRFIQRVAQIPQCRAALKKNGKKSLCSQALRHLPLLKMFSQQKLGRCGSARWNRNLGHAPVTLVTSDRQDGSKDGNLCDQSSAVCGEQKMIQVKLKTVVRGVDAADHNREYRPES